MRLTLALMFAVRGLSLLFAVSLLVGLPACRDEGSAEILARLEQIDSRLQRLESSRSAGDPGTGAPGAGAASAGEAPAATPHATASGTAAPGKAASGKAASGKAAPGEGGGSATEPVASVVARSEDFATVWAGERVERSFRVANPGGARLEILAVTPSCSCLSIEIPSRFVEPGDELELPIALDTRKLKGQVRQTAVLRTNDPRSPEIELSMTGIVQPIVEHDPFVLLRVRPGDLATERRFRLRHVPEGSWSPQLAARAADRFQIRLEEVLPGKEHDLVVRVDPPFEIGYERTEVRVLTGLEEPEFLDIRVNLHIPDRLDVVPSQLLLSDTTERGVARQLTFTNHGETLVNVTGVSVDDTAIRATLSAREPGKVYLITVTLPAGHRIAPGGTVLRVRTDDPERPVVEVPIRSLASRTAETEGAARAPSRPALALLDQAAPDFALTTVRGEALSADDFAGRVATVINFFAPNCGFCKRQIPVLERVRQDFEPRGVRFVNVREVMGGREYTIDETEEMLALLGAGHELAIDDANTVGRQFRVSGFPTLFVIDREGVVRHVAIGARQALDEELGGQLEELLSP